MYENLKKAGIEVLFDDRDMRPGEKFADSDLIGIPLRVVVSDKTLKEQGVEVKERATGKIECMSFDTFTSYFKK